MKSPLSFRVEQIKPSGIRRFFDMANSMKGVISLGVGEPDFITPRPVCEAAATALKHGFTFYTETEGLKELRKEIACYMRLRFNVSYSPDSEIIVTSGGSQALDITMRTILDPGDEVIIAEPSYLAYAPLVTLAGGVPKLIKTSSSHEFKLTPEQIQQAITPYTKALLLCSPNNPTGSLLNKEELKEIAALVIDHDLLVITDEIYAELSYDEAFCSIASLEEMKERTILISGFSKGFAMTGWRLGFVCAPASIRKALLQVQQYTVGPAPVMNQYGAIEALKNHQVYIEEMKNSYRSRRDYMVKSLNELGLDCHLPGGAFYVFPSIRKTGLTSEQFAESLLLQERVAVVPGNVFGDGGEGHIRCSYASSMETLQEAVKRIKQFLDNLNRNSA